MRNVTTLISPVLPQFLGVRPPNRPTHRHLLFHPFHTHQVHLPRLLAILSSRFVAFRLNFFSFQEHLSQPDLRVYVQARGLITPCPHLAQAGCRP
jgi:hypothetical protein